MLSPLNDLLGWTLSGMSKDLKITALTAAALVLQPFAWRVGDVNWLINDGCAGRGRGAFENK
jgi:hypothetical protein